MNNDGEIDSLRQQLAAERERLKSVYQMASLGRLLAGIVHEINTPIGSIFSNNEVMRRSIETLVKQAKTASENGQPPPPKMLDILDTLKSLAAVDKLACERISAVIRSLKTYARVDAGELRRIDIRDILRNTLKLSGCEFRRRITVETDFVDIPEVECYPAELSQVFLNLLVNAGQAIEGEGKITVGARVEGDWVVVSITDTGTGIREADRGKIFSPGFSTKPIGIGTGLGLSISRKIVVEVHHGEIDFKSEPGTGTTFHVRLPINQPARS